MSGAFVWTLEQTQAIETVDRDVLVSAAAGSGKTAVLAARCAYLVCDAPPPFRCDVDRLLVVTFTEAAAGEMKDRIRRAIRQRSADQPNDRRLRAQAALVDTAQISTIHAFCLWMVRRWFHRLDIDATAQLLDAEESRLLRTETLDALFEDLYRDTADAGQHFQALVEDYGLGQDREIAAFVLGLSGFLQSRPDPEHWLARAGNLGETRQASVIDATRAAMIRELQRQAEYLGAAANYVQKELPVGVFYGEKLTDYAESVTQWHQQLDAGADSEAIRQQIMAFELSSKGSPRFGKDTDEETLRQRDQARDLFKEARETFLKKRLQATYCRFTHEEMIAGLEKVSPYVSTMANLTGAFMDRLDKAKRGLGVMDFSDLERFAYRLLTEKEESETQNPVATELRQRFAQVLVDEFQDVNPLQASLLSAVSHEGNVPNSGNDPNEGNAPNGGNAPNDGNAPNTPDACGNLFTVGDVKQSIYRFRLAEPGMFLDRARVLDDPRVPGTRIDLQRNYRSTPRILKAVNAVFARLMRDEVGGVDYDERSRLVSGSDPTYPDAPVEMHILEKQLDGDASDAEDGEPRYVDITDPAQWRGVQREAFLIATRIGELMAEGITVEGDDGRRPLRYGDICILLRSTKHTAGAMANMLEQAGIPTQTDAGDDLFAAREVRDILSLLEVLDNFQQDISLAAVLRAGIVAAPLTEDELVAIRTIDRRGAFHESVRAYAAQGTDASLREKLTRIMRRLKRYRTLMRTRVLAEGLATIYRETGYLAFVGGLSGGVKRRENLIALHERARQFGQFRRQGLRRFLGFVESLRASGDPLGGLSLAGPDDDVVRVMSIHKAKGLEFPVVFVAELGRRFNLGDSTGRFLFDRKVGISLKAVDCDRLIEYPTALHRWCARESSEAALAEELRVWYVATTRAKERLILVGSDDLAALDRRRAIARLAPTPTRLATLNVLSARSPLHWFVSALGHMPSGEVDWDATKPVGAMEGTEAASDTRFVVRRYESDVILDWRLEATQGKKGREGKAQATDAAKLYRAAATLAPLPDDEPVSHDLHGAEGAGAGVSGAEKVLTRLDYAYPHLEASSIRAAFSASDAKRRYLPLSDAVEAVPLITTEAVPPAEASFSTVGQSSAARDAAARRGRNVHMLLQFMCLERATSAEGIAAEVQRLVADGRIPADDVASLDVAGLTWFFATSLGQRVRGADDYRREWMFLSTEPLERFDPTVRSGPDDRALVRGVIDGLLVWEDGLEVIDFKTDRVSGEAVARRALDYTSQVQLYASAAANVFGKRVKGCHLVFLHGQQIVEISEGLS